MNNSTDEETNKVLSPAPDKQSESNWKDFFRFTLIALAIVIPFRIFIAQPFMVSGASMSPTFETGQYLIVDEISYRLEPPNRGDVVILKKPRQESEYLIKRVIGLPGETVVLKEGYVSIKTSDSNDEMPLSEPYVKNRSVENSEYKLENNEYFVMGDNRPASLDSRFVGPISRDHIIGRAFIRLFPISKISLLPGEYE